MQIKALRADIKTVKDVKVTRWLGLQGDKYVALPTEWVAHNFDNLIRVEAIQRAENLIAGTNVTTQWLSVPPGDSRDHDPPQRFAMIRGQTTTTKVKRTIARWGD